MTWLLLGAALAFGILHIIADYRQAWGQTYVFKPLAMIGIIGLVFVHGPPDSPYRWWILSGLVLSLAGDIFLMLRPARFLSGLVSFLFAHLAYICAFSLMMVELHGPAAVAAGGAGAIALALMWPGLRGMQLPVVLYVVAIAAMVATSVSAGLDAPTAGRLSAAAGACLFLVSDACLGFARFRSRFPGDQAAILGTYYPAQALIALSAGILSP